MFRVTWRICGNERLTDRQGRNRGESKSACSSSKLRSHQFLIEYSRSIWWSFLLLLRRRHRRRQPGTSLLVDFLFARQCGLERDGGLVVGNGWLGENLSRWTSGISRYLHRTTHPIEYHRTMDLQTFRQIILDSDHYRHNVHKQRIDDTHSKTG